MSKQIALVDAIVANDLQRVKYCLETGADVNLALDQANVTPLHFAAQSSDISILQELLAQGADFQAKTVPDGETPLDIARMHHQHGLVQILDELS